MTNLSEKLEQLSAAATQGEWISIQSSINPERHYITNEHHAIFASEIGGTKPTDLKFVTSLVNLYRTGQLVAVQADDATVERVAKAIDPEIWLGNQPIPTRGDTIDFYARRQKSISQAKAAISALAAKGDAPPKPIL